MGAQWSIPRVRFVKIRKPDEQGLIALFFLNKMYNHEQDFNDHFLSVLYVVCTGTNG